MGQLMPLQHCPSESPPMVPMVEGWDPGGGKDDLVPLSLCYARDQVQVLPLLVKYQLLSILGTACGLSIQGYPTSSGSSHQKDSFTVLKLGALKTT